jgi:hypothetical protein
MCEPSHSILQYNPPEKQDDDFDGGVTSMSAQAGQYSRDGLLAGLGQWAKKIRGWMHLSMLGKGHSETIGARSNGLMYRYDDVFRLYEAHWWNRRVIRDGAIRRGSYVDAVITDEQLKAATDYAMTSSIGDLSQLRRFLEQSLLKTDRASGYLAHFRNDFLNVDGRSAFDQACKDVLNVTPSRLMSTNISNDRSRALLTMTAPEIEREIKGGVVGSKKSRPLSLESITKFVIGFTRKRKLLVPEWADDDSLWTSGLGKPKLT